MDEPKFVISAKETGGSWIGYMLLQKDGRAILVPVKHAASQMSYAEAWCVMRLAIKDSPFLPQYDLAITEAA